MFFKSEDLKTLLDLHELKHKFKVTLWLLRFKFLARAQCERKTFDAFKK